MTHKQHHVRLIKEADRSTGLSNPKLGITLKTILGLALDQVRDAHSLQGTWSMVALQGICQGDCSHSAFAFLLSCSPPRASSVSGDDWGRELWLRLEQGTGSHGCLGAGLLWFPGDKPCRDRLTVTEQRAPSMTPLDVAQDIVQYLQCGRPWPL
jgi:hypothetical protein